MARVVALVSDLMLASRVEAPLRAAGHEVQVSATPPEGAAEADVIVADLDAVDAAEVTAIGPPTLGFHQHTDVETKRAAEAAGFDVVVPRSRMVRELIPLVEGLAQR